MQIVSSKIKAMRGARCKLSPYAVNGEGGYPQKYDPKIGKQRSHVRMVLEEKLGRPIKPSLSALHHCDNRRCIEPTHLYEGTQGRNMLDKMERGRCPVGLSNGNARYSDDFIRTIKQAVGTQQEIADKYGCHQTTVSAIKRHTTRRHVK